MRLCHSFKVFFRNGGSAAWSVTSCGGVAGPVLSPHVCVGDIAMKPNVNAFEGRARRKSEWKRSVHRD